jgi:hypothetical protein
MRLMEITAPNGMRIVITDKSDPRNVQMFSKIIDGLAKGK